MDVLERDGYCGKQGNHNCSKDSNICWKESNICCKESNICCIRIHLKVNTMHVEYTDMWKQEQNDQATTKM